MDSILRTAIVTAVWVLVQGFVGFGLLGRKGRPYKVPFVVVHLVVFVFICTGWFFTVQELATVSGNHLGTWIAQIVMGLAIVSQLVGGVIMTAGRTVPAPSGMVLTHKIGIFVTLAGALAGIVFILLGV